MSKPIESLESRFARLVDKTGDCWLWNGHRDKNGYGEMRIGQQTVKAHRAAWEMANGSIPNGLGVLHRCDNPPCVNPAHLFIGTQGDNMRDCHTKKRIHELSANSLPGEKHPLSKLSDRQRLEIAEACKTHTQREVATMFGVTQATINRAKKFAERIKAQLEAEDVALIKP